ncbi:MAG: DsrE family protein [Gallionellaceae bacterium]|jgi:intracellular sulfur oxidation DsrE/DsrF family protein
MKIIRLLALSLVFLVATAQAETVSKAIVVQGNGDKAQFERALKLASNMHEILTKAKFEVVVFGPTVKLLTEDSEEIPLIQKMQSEGIKIIACERSMKTDNILASSLAPGVTVTPFGAVHIVNRQKQGWQYFKP